VTPLSVSAITGEKAFQNLFDLEEGTRSPHPPGA
jgi:hypothetical protein